VSSYHYLLDELEGRLLDELRRMLQGDDIDTAAISQSIAIVNKAKTVRDADSNASAAVKAQQAGVAATLRA
jgi:hypothetical protein